MQNAAVAKVGLQTEVPSKRLENCEPYWSTVVVYLYQRKAGFKLKDVLFVAVHMSWLLHEASGLQRKHGAQYQDNAVCHDHTNDQHEKSFKGVVNNAAAPVHDFSIAEEKQTPPFYWIS